MRVRWIKDHLLGGGKVAVAGQTSEELHPMEAQRKVNMGYAQLLGEASDRPAPPASVSGHEQAGDPIPARRGGKE